MYCMRNVYISSDSTSSVVIMLVNSHYVHHAVLIMCVVSLGAFEGRRVTGFDWIEQDRAKGLARRRTIALAAEALK